MLSKQVADYTVNMKFEDLPPAVIEAGRLAIMDWLGSVMAGSREPPARMVAKVVLRAGGIPRATLIGFDQLSSALNAALVNGTSCHILELDDLHRSSIMHPAAPIISAAAAAAEERNAGGRDLLTAVVAGYETGIRIAEAVTPAHYHYWHTTATCGTFGAAAAAAKIIALDPGGVVNALGSAGSQAAGLWEFLEDGAMTKHLHPGKAAMNGLLAALLAEEGFTGATRILEGDKGFFRATADEYFTDRVTAGLGKEFRILGNSYKIYPSCRHTHSAVDLALKLAGEGLDPTDIASIMVKTYRHACDLVGGTSFETPYKAKFSLPYCFARALVDKKLDLRSFDFSKPHDPLVVQLVAKCRVVLEPELEKMYPFRWPAAVTVILKDGRVIEASTDYPRGDPENPAGIKEMQEKFRQLALLCQSEETVDRILELLADLDQLERIRDLFDLTG